MLYWTGTNCTELKVQWMPNSKQAKQQTTTGTLFVSYSPSENKKHSTNSFLSISKMMIHQGQKVHAFISSILKKQNKKLLRDDVCCTKRLEPDTTEMRVGAMVTHSTYKAKLKELCASVHSHRRLYLNLPNVIYNQLINNNQGDSEGV